MHDAWLALAAQSTAAVPWDIVLGVGSLVMLAGGITAVVRRSMRPGQALTVLGLAVAVSALSAVVLALPAADALPRGVYATVIILTTTAGAAAMAVAVVSRPRK